MALILAQASPASPGSPGQARERSELVQERHHQGPGRSLPLFAHDEFRRPRILLRAEHLLAVNEQNQVPEVLYRSRLPQVTLPELMPAVATGTEEFATTVATRSDDPGLAPNDEAPETATVSGALVGGHGRIRTCDFDRVKVALYR